MKKLLLLTGVSVISVAAMATDFPQPKEFEDVFFTCMSPNGKYVLSEGDGSVKIINLETGHSDDFINVDGTAAYGGGIGKCVSNNGIVVGTTDYIAAEYFKDGDWYVLDVPDYATSTCTANAITPDGSRICGSFGISDIVLDGDALMQVPCIWNAEGEGYGMPIRLPHPETDFTGRIPQYVTAVDISEDGKTVVGQVRDATGYFNYPIVYKENENGEWSYEIIHEELMNPDNLVFPEFPGEGPSAPSYEDYMTPEEIAEYNHSVQEWFDSFGTIDYPDFRDYMSEEELAAFQAAEAEFEELNAVWYEAFLEWFDVHNSCMDKAPTYEFNSVRISPDGKTIGSTVVKSNYDDPLSWFPTSNYHVWIIDIETGAITKYNQLPDLNLTYLGNDGIGLASTSVGASSDSFVLHDGVVDNMFYWMSVNCIDYATWMSENMIFDKVSMDYNEETGEYDFVYEKQFMSGRAVGTPDLSKLALTVQNTWDYENLGYGYIFDIAAYEEAGVEAVRPADETQTIYDLSGRKLNSVTAPGIYIINGEKKVIR